MKDRFLPGQYSILTSCFERKFIGAEIVYFYALKMEETLTVWSVEYSIKILKENLSRYRSLLQKMKKKSIWTSVLFSSSKLLIFKSSLPKACFFATFFNCVAHNFNFLSSKGYSTWKKTSKWVLPYILGKIRKQFFLLFFSFKTPNLFNFRWSPLGIACKCVSLVL